jgi:tellurite resistance protein TehA-like permease
MLEYIVFGMACFLAGVGIVAIVKCVITCINDIAEERKYK